MHDPDVQYQNHKPLGFLFDRGKEANRLENSNKEAPLPCLYIIYMPSNMQLL